jgi:hypothetical protein
MAGKRIRNSVDEVVIALCLDYERRQRAIEQRSATRRTETEFRYYNFKIFDAAAEVVGEAKADIYINEIGNRIGYAKSSLDCLSEVTYKKYKRKAMDNIAKKLHLCD